MTKEELEKENAELKDALKGKVCKCMTYFNFKDLENKLTKAKDIIKKYYKYNSSCEYFYEDIDKEAEQFISEVEK